MNYAIIALVFTLTFVGSSFVTSFTGFEANQLPIPQIDPPIQPAGYAFAIWGPIYGWLIASAVFGVWKRGTDAGWDVMRLPLIISLVLGTPWLWVATQSSIAATVLIFAMTVPAIMATLRAPSYDRWLARAPVSLYAGWLTAASFVSLGSTMAGYGVWMDQDGWAVAGILAALLVASTVMQMGVTIPAYGVAVVWALVGILVANGFDGWVGWLTCVGIAAISLLVVRQFRAIR